MWLWISDNYSDSALLTWRQFVSSDDHTGDHGNRCYGKQQATHDDDVFEDVRMTQFAANHRCRATDKHTSEWLSKV